MSSGNEKAASGILTFPLVSEPRVSVLIPSHNQPELLEICLKSLLEHVPDSIPFEVIIVLNAPVPELASFVRDRTSGIVILESAANLGVAGGYNLARTAARGDFFLLLHDDVEITPGWLENLLETLEGRPAAGAAGSFQYFPDGRPQRAGSILWKDATTSPAWGKGEPDARVFNEIRPVDYVGTCSTLVKAETWDAIGGMDEEIYPAYFVDVDLCMRIRRLGQYVVCDPRSKVKHHQGTSSRKRFRGYLNHRNRGYFVSRWADELAGREPPAPEDPAGIARAEQRSVSQAKALEQTWRGYPAASFSPPPPPLPSLERERSYFRKEISVLADYSEKLEARETQLSGSLERARAELKKARARVASLEKNHRKNKSALRKLFSAIRSFVKPGR